MSQTPQVRDNKRRILQATVISDKMQKTRVVQVFWASKHSVYKKIIKRVVKYKVHDEKNESKTGDVIQIMECRPMSKDKRWVMLNILKASSEVQ